MPDTIDIWRTARELVGWRGTDAPQYVAQKAAEACDEQAWAFWLEVERAVNELLTQVAPPTRRSTDKKTRRGWASGGRRVSS
jgi:hypothetical protein